MTIELSPVLSQSWQAWMYMISSSYKPSTQVQGCWLFLIRLAWVAVALITVSLFTAIRLNEFQAMRTPCDPASGVDCSGYSYQLSIKEARDLQNVGISIDFRAVYYTANSILSAVISLAVAVVIFWRKSADWMAVFVSLTLLLFGIFFYTDPEPFMHSHYVWGKVAVTGKDLGIFCLFVFLFLFPDGHFVPRWTRWLVAIWFTIGMLGLLEDIVPQVPSALRFLESFEELSQFMLFIGTLFIGVFSQVYRYRRVSGPVSRQQTKWFTYGLVSLILGASIFAILESLFPALNQPGALHEAYFAVQNLIFTILFLLIPVTIGFSILRYRLFEIDLIIRRTLVYTTLTAMLALVYFGLVVLLEGALRSLVSSSGQITTVISTLAIAALFTPLRRRVQDFIDRRFYRHKYNAEQALAQFAAITRHETDLKALTTQVLAIVQNTIQPEQVSLWLNPAAHGEQQAAGTAINLENYL